MLGMTSRMFLCVRACGCVCVCVCVCAGAAGVGGVAQGVLVSALAYL